MAFDTAIYSKLELTVLCMSFGFLLGASANMSFAQDPFPEGCLWGLFQSNTPIQLYSINQFEVQSGKKAATIMFFIDWTYDFPAQDCETIIKYGAIPHVTWEPWIIGEENGIKLKDIIKGKWDKYIRRWAQEARDFGYPFFLRMGHEMNGDWYPWSAAKNDYDASRFVAAWHHVYKIFEKAGATNVIWVWCPMNADFPASPWNKCSKYYPGDEYVDWVGIDGYNWGRAVSWGIWIPFERLFKKRYEEFVELYPDKPIMIGEFACSTIGGDKGEWIRRAFANIKNEFPRIKAIVWFNINKECDWRLNSSTDAFKAFSDVIKDDYFKSDPEIISSLAKDFKLPVDAQKKLGPIEIHWEKPTVSCAFAKEPPKIDGVAGKKEWNTGNTIVIDSKKKIVLSKGGSSWKGPRDLSVKAQLQWDKENLYFLAEVADDKPFINAQEGEKIWDGDSVEIAFGLNPSDDPERTTFSPSDFQVCFSVKDPKGNNLSVWSWQLGGPASGVIYALKPNKRPRGYIVEAAIPWKTFVDFIPEPDMKISFNLALNDSDKKGKGREVQMLWSGNSSFYLDPSMWGWLRFLE